MILEIVLIFIIVLICTRRLRLFSISSHRYIFTYCLTQKLLLNFRESGLRFYLNFTRFFYFTWHRIFVCYQPRC